MDRRKFILGAAAALASSQVGCPGNMFPPLPSLQTAQVSFQQLAQVVTQQQCEEWCWAACISMLFDFYGHPLTQAEIVQATYGNVICLPAGSSTTIGRDLSRTYVDDRGVPFSSQVVAAYDFLNGINTFDNRLIINELNTNNPMLYANTQHAMVMFAASYFATDAEPNIQSVQVVDPWPFSPRFHPLSPAEMVPAHLGGAMTFLASIRLT